MQNVLFQPRIVSQKVRVSVLGLLCPGGLPCPGGLQRLVNSCGLRGRGCFCERIGVLTDTSRHFYRPSSSFYSSRRLIF